MKIAINSKHTGDPKRDNRGYAEPMTSEQLDQLLSEDWLRQMVADIRGGNEKVKDWLPFACPHYSAFRNNHRAQADIMPEAFTFMTCVDVDDKTLVDEAVRKTLAIVRDDDSDWQDKVLRMDYSARKKLHIWLRLPVGKTISETQQEFCKEIGVPYDESCITPERFIYLTGKDEEIFRSPQWLQPIAAEELEERREAFLNRGLDVDGRALKTPKDTKGSDPFVSSAEAATDRTRYIFDECMKEAGLKPAHLVREGARHQSLKSILSVGATQLLTKEELLGVLQERMPQNWQDQNIQQLVSDFYEKYTDPNQKMSQFQRKVLARSLQIEEVDAEPEEETTISILPQVPKEISMQASLSEIYANPLPPKLPAQLPKLISLLTKNTPDIYKATVAHAVFPSLGAHLHKVQFQYTDNVMHEATLMNVAMAGTGAGKGCIDEPINRIMADIRERDSENERRLDEYNREMNRKGANKDKRERPDDLVIQEIHSDTTHAALVQRLGEAKERFLYMKLNEIELFDKLKGTGGQQFVIMCQAFDPKNRYGQTRASTQSVNATVRLRFNWNAAGTVGAVSKYFAKVLTKGPISRINFCTIPEREIGAEQPVYGVYDEDFDNALKPFIKNLTEAGGDVECKQAHALAKRMIAECAEFSRLSQDRVYENLSFRANVIAWLKACVLYVANGRKWEKTIEPFIRWSLHYDLWCKMHFFADGIRREEYAGEHSNTRGPRNLLELLPDTFTIEDAKRIRRQQGMDTERAYSMILNWKSRKYIYQISDISFEKLKYKVKNN